MKWPKLKHPLLCNIILVGSVMAPPILFLFLPALPVTEFIPPLLLALIILSPWVLALWFMISHFPLLMATSMCLEMYHAHLQHGGAFPVLCVYLIPTQKARRDTTPTWYPAVRLCMIHRP